MTQTYHANGKLLLTAEYFILDGAVGLALPTKFGQTLSEETSEENGVFWKSIDNENKVWFEAKFDEQLDIISTSNQEIASTLKNILTHCTLTTQHIQLTTHLNFPQNWGLGSSSTLISLLAQLSNKNPYQLLEKTFGGSGYDIACATANSAILYQVENQERKITPINFQPNFSQHLYFLHLNKKQNSREGIQHYKNLNVDKAPIIEQLNALTQNIANAIDFDEFCHYLNIHETIISEALQLPKVKELYFQDFPYTIKSLGAWGGDFVLVACNEPQAKIESYFQEKGFSTLLPFDTIIL